MAIGFGASGSWAYAASGSVTPTLAAHAAGDMLIVRVAYKSSAIATCTASTATSGWAKVGEIGGSTNSGNGTGTVACASFYKIAASGAETNPTITFSQTVTQVGHTALTYTKGGSDTWVTPVGAGGQDTSSGTGFLAAASPSTSGDDVIDYFCGIADDTTFSVRASWQDGGVVLGTESNRPVTAGSDTSGADGAYDGGYRLITSGGPATGGGVLATLGTSEIGGAWATRLRVTAGGGGGATEGNPHFMGGGFYG